MTPNDRMLKRAEARMRLNQYIERLRLRVRLSRGHDPVDVTEGHRAALVRATMARDASAARACAAYVQGLLP